MCHTYTQFPPLEAEFLLCFRRVCFPIWSTFKKNVINYHIMFRSLIHYPLWVRHYVTHREREICKFWYPIGHIQIRGILSVELHHSSTKLFTPQLIHYSLIPYFIFSSVSSWTRLGPNQSGDIISDYKSCALQAPFTDPGQEVPTFNPTASYNLSSFIAEAKLRWWMHGRFTAALPKLQNAGAHLKIRKLKKALDRIEVLLSVVLDFVIKFLKWVNILYSSHTAASHTHQKYLCSFH